MRKITSRELQNNTRELLKRVANGEVFEITLSGKAGAILQPIEQRPQWMSSAEFIREIPHRQADAGLTEQLRDLSPDSTDDLTW
ncbi:MAG: type II toxin-antitoxin system prevent-host-death family antitoxin [Actinomycetes bacterium]